MLMSDKMEFLPLLLMFFTVSGYAYLLQPRLTVMQIPVMDRDHKSELRSEQRRNVSLSTDERKTEAENVAAVEERMSEREPQEENPVRKTVNTGNIVEERRKEGWLMSETKADKIDKTRRNKTEGGKVGENLDRNEGQVKVSEKKNNKGVPEDGAYETDVKFRKNDQMEQLKQTIAEEERESELVAGIGLHAGTRDSHEDERVKQEITEEKQETDGRVQKKDIKHLTHEFMEPKKEDHTAFNKFTPLLRTSEGRKESEISATIQAITLFQKPPRTPPSHQHNVHPPPTVTATKDPPVFFNPSTLHAKVSPSVTFPSPTVSVVPTEVRSVSLLEDLLIEVRKNLKQNELAVGVKANEHNVMAKTPLFKPAQREPHITYNQRKFSHSVQDPTSKPEEEQFLVKDLKSEPTSNENRYNTNNNSIRLALKPNLTQHTSRPKTVRLMENIKVTKPSIKSELATDKTPSVKQNKSSKTRAKKKFQEKRKKDNKTEKPPEKKKKRKAVTTPMPFPYFMDNYCPPECACYGRVVQCSDKGVDKVPYGIPYNARYILLMNNHINIVQLGLLSGYDSMEFLVLSNNQLSDGAIEGVFEGVLALKRLYLDRNLLEVMPRDLPLSLEELRLDNNQLSVISEAAWAQCPNLLVLSLSNNSLGNGSGSLPNSVFSNLCKLNTLNLSHNQLKSVPLGLPLSIKELNLKGNFIEHFHRGVFNGISELVVLDLSANSLTDKGFLQHSLLNATHLESLNLEGNGLKHVPRHLPYSLKTLNLEGNLITSIQKAAFSYLKYLEHLGLARNKIYKVAPGAFRTLHLLHQLDLSHNTLNQVPRQLPQGLHSVALNHNKIQSVPRDAFCWGNQTLSLSGLVQVQLEHNFIDMGKLDTHAFRCLRGFQVVHFY